VSQRGYAFPGFEASGSKTPIDAPSREDPLVLLDAVGDLLPAAVAVALSPFPIVAIVLILAAPRARTSGVAFAIGWAAGLAAVAYAVVVVAAAAGGAGLDRPAAAGYLKLALGAGFILAAASQWRKRPEPAAEPEVPGWMESLATITPGRSLGLGAALAGANPKTVVLTLAAGASIVEADLGLANTAVAIGAYVAIGSLTVVGSVIFYLVAPERAARRLGVIRAFMIRHGWIIVMVVLLLLGAKLLGDGLARLLG
jgi:threonine/homoserine/homoserine lactone efflux protein